MPNLQHVSFSLDTATFAPSPPLPDLAEPPDPSPPPAASQPPLLTALLSSYAASPLGSSCSPQSQICLLLRSSPPLLPASVFHLRSILPPSFTLGFKPPSSSPTSSLPSQVIPPISPAYKSSRPPWPSVPANFGFNILMWCMESPFLVRMKLELMDWKSLDSSGSMFINLESIFVYSSYTSIAGMRIFTAVCRVILHCYSVQSWNFWSPFVFVNSSIPTILDRLVVGDSALLAAYLSTEILLPLPVVFWPSLPACRLNAYLSAASDIAALCRFLLRLCLMHPLIYGSSCQPIEQSLLLKPYLRMAWTAALFASGLELDRERCYFSGWWCLLVIFPPTPPVPPDPPDFIISSHCFLVSWIFGSTVSTLSCLGDMSTVTAHSPAAFTLPSNQGLILLVRWIGWLLTSLSSIARIILPRLKLLSSHLPLYEDVKLVFSSPLPLYEDLVTLPLYEDLDILPLYEDLVTLPLYEDLVPVYREFMDSSSLLTSFVRFFAPLSSPFDLNGWDTRGVIKGSIYRCLFAFVAILEIENCALVAVSISGVRSSAHGFFLLNNSIVDEIRGLLRDFYLFKCFVALISLCFPFDIVVISAFYATMAMYFGNFY